MSTAAAAGLPVQVRGPERADGGAAVEPPLDGVVPGPLDRPTTAQRVAATLRERILRGELPPGTQFQEQQLTASLRVSRNTLREAFQILVGEHLLVREAHRGVFVRRLTPQDVRDIYRFRRLVECGALTDPRNPTALTAMRAAVVAGRAAARRRQWQDAGTADLHFHLAVTALAGSARLDQALRTVLAELRLAFQVVPDLRALHAPFLPLNAQILSDVERGDHGAAAALLRRYLDDAEERVAAAVAAAT